MFPQRATRADLALSRRIIGNEKSHACIPNQMKVAVEVDGVSAVPDDLMSVAVLLIKAQCHGIQLRVKAVLPRVHLSRSLRAQDLCALIISVLKMRNHEVR